MKIIMSSSDEKHTVRIPTRVIINHLSAIFVFKKYVKSSHVTSKQISKLLRQFNRFRRKHKDFKFIELESGQDSITIIL